MEHETGWIRRLKLQWELWNGAKPIVVAVAFLLLAVVIAFWPVWLGQKGG